MTISDSIDGHKKKNIVLLTINPFGTAPISDICFLPDDGIAVLDRRVTDITVRSQIGKISICQVMFSTNICINKKKNDRFILKACLFNKANKEMNTKKTNKF